MRKKVLFVLIASYIDTHPGEFPTVRNQAWQDLVSFILPRLTGKLTPDSGVSINTGDFAI
jgi:hypothetical protein